MAFSFSLSDDAPRLGFCRVTHFLFWGGGGEELHTPDGKSDGLSIKKTKQRNYHDSGLRISAIQKTFQPESAVYLYLIHSMRLPQLRLSVQSSSTPQGRVLVSGVEVFQ